MLLLLFLSACSASHGGESDGDAGESPIVLRVAGPQFALCRCHHGCGPGADGIAILFADNRSAGDAFVDVTSLTLVPEAGGPELSTAMPGSRLDPADMPSRERPRRVAPGGHEQLTFTAYLDLTQDPEPLAGLYRVRFAATVDGRARDVPSDPFRVEFTGGDPGCP